MIFGLTRVERDVFNFIKEDSRKDGVCPSVREICAALGKKSTSSVHRAIGQLEKKGAIKRKAYMSRSIVIVEDSCPHCGKSLDLSV